MPELVEAQLMVDGLQDFVGMSFIDVKDDLTRSNNILVDKRVLVTFLTHSYIHKVVRIGKRPFVFVRHHSTGEVRVLDFFLSMSGTFNVKEETNVSRILFKLSKGNLYFEDARCWARIRLRTEYEFHNLYDPVLSRTVDPLVAPTLDVFNKLWQADYIPELSIKDLLMDQGILIGIGNYYAQEVLYDAKILPHKQVKDIDKQQMFQIAYAMHVHIKRAYENGGLSLKNWHNPDGTLGHAQDYGHVYRKKNCTTCDTTVEKMEISGRATYYCPNCQK